MSEKELNFWDKMLPNQPEYSNKFQGGKDSYDRLLYETIAQASGLKDPGEDFDLTQSDKFSIVDIGSNPIVHRLLEFLVRLSGARRILEIGTFIGISAMCMARAMPAEGRVVTVEKFDHFAGIARANFAANGLAERITLLEGDALELIDSLGAEGPYDMIFVDGNKERYGEYFERLAPFLASKGLFVIDDCLWHGDPLNPEPTTEKGRGVKASLDLAAKSDAYHRLVLPLCNGIMVLMRKDG